LDLRKIQLAGSGIFCRFYLDLPSVMSSKNVTKVVWYIPVQLSSLTTQGLWFQVSVFRCQLNSASSKLKTQKLMGKEAIRLESWKARWLWSFKPPGFPTFQPWAFSFEPNCL